MAARSGKRAMIGLTLSSIILLFGATANAPVPSHVYGFVLSDFAMLFYRGDEAKDCPQGRSHTVREAFLATQSQAEIKRLLLPANSVEFERRYKVDYVFGPDGRDICSDADAFDTADREIQKPVKSKIAPGMNLDGASGGKTAPGTCAHEKFTGPTGEVGVDNQFFRAIACNTFWRGASTGVGDGTYAMNMAENPVAILVTGVESWQNDPEVEVLIAAANDRPAADTKRHPVAGSSLSITDNPKYRTRIVGKIVDGVLITEPADLTFPYSWNAASGGEMIMTRLRLRLRFTPEGDLVGEAAGYRPIDNAISILRVGGPGVASVAGVECASVRKTLRLLADGDRDPKTHVCKAVSSAMSFGARPAFVFDKGVLLNEPRP